MSGRVELPAVERCEVCKFWKHDSDGTEWYTEGMGYHGVKVGFCRLVPPVLVELNNDFDGPAARNPLSWQQPAVKSDDWCGEYQPTVPVANGPVSDERLAAAIRTLTQRSQVVVNLRWGIESKENPGATIYTLDQVARILRITRERVRQLEKKAIEAIQDRFPDITLPKRA